MALAGAQQTIGCGGMETGQPRVDGGGDADGTDRLGRGLA